MKGIRINCKTGEIEKIDDGVPSYEEIAALPRGLNIEKLKKILVNAGIIKSESEIE